mgnify:CR=1 FL=1
MSKEVIIKYNHLFQALVDECSFEDIERLKEWRKHYDQNKH